MISWRIRPVLVPYIEPLGDWDDIKSNRGHMVVLVTLHTQRSAITIIQDMSIVDNIVRLFMRIWYFVWINHGWIVKMLTQVLNKQENTFNNWYLYLVNIQQYFLNYIHDQNNCEFWKKNRDVEFFYFNAYFSYLVDWYKFGI